MTLYTAGHLHTVVPHCSHSRAPIVHTAVPRENNEHGCVYLRCRAVCKLPGCVEGHPWYRELWGRYFKTHESDSYTHTHTHNIYIYICIYIYIYIYIYYVAILCLTDGWVIPIPIERFDILPIVEFPLCLYKEYPFTQENCIITLPPTWGDDLLSLGESRGSRRVVHNLFRQKITMNKFNCFQSCPIKGPAWLGTVSRNVYRNRALLSSRLSKGS